MDIDDDLMTRCLILADDNSQIAIVALDINLISNTLRQAITERTSAVTDIPVESIRVAPTGNATSPVLSNGNTESDPVARYTDFLPDIVAGNVLRANSKLEPTAAGYATVNVPNICCYENPKLAYQGSDRLDTTHLLAVQNSEGQILSLVVSSPCPAIVRAPSQHWTADYPGALCWMLEQSNIETPIFVQGDTDGIAPFDWYRGNPEPSHQDRSADDANALALIIATQLAQAIPRITPRRNVAPADLIAPFSQLALSAR